MLLAFGLLMFTSLLLNTSTSANAVVLDKETIKNKVITYVEGAIENHLPNNPDDTITIKVVNIPSSALVFKTH